MKGLIDSGKAGGAVVLAFFLVCLLTLSDYGIVWDAGYWFPFGDQHLKYFKTFDAQYLNWPGRDTEGYRMYGPFAGIRASLSHLVFHRGLGMHPVDARNLPFIFDATAILLAVLLFTRRYFGGAAAFWAALLLALYPRFLAHAHNNVSDLPAACFFTAAAFFLVHGIMNRSWHFLFLSAVCGGILFDIRPQNLPFLFMVGLLWLVFSGHARSALLSILKTENQAWKKILLMLMLFAAAVYIFRPGAWLQPLAEMKEVFNFFLHRPAYLGNVRIFFMGKTYLTAAPPYYPWVMLFFGSPPLFLFALSSGLVALAVSARRHPEDKEQEKRSALFFLFLWFLITVGKHTVLKTGNYDGVRHFLEAFPAMAVLGGAGLVAFWQRVSHRFLQAQKTRGIVSLGLSFAMILSLLYPLLVLHPYEICYYNFFIRGIRGADHYFETEYSGHVYREAFDWLEKNIEPGSVICVPLAGKAAIFYAQHENLYDFEVIQTNKMRELNDRLTKMNTSVNRKDQDIYAMFILRKGWMVNFGIIGYCLRRLEPFHTINVCDIPICAIYKLPLQSP